MSLWDRAASLAPKLSSTSTPTLLSIDDENQVQDQPRQGSMSSPVLPVPTAAPPLLPITQLDGESGYLRWKESVLLRLHTIGVADVLTEERPLDEKTAAGKQWAHMDALCRGHILATLSDRLLPVYAPHATAAAVWRAVARTYDLDLTVDVPLRSVPYVKAITFQYTEDEPVMEQLALLEGLTTNSKLDNSTLCFIVKQFPTLSEKVAAHDYRLSMDEIWEIARRKERLARVQDIRRARDDPQTSEDPQTSDGQGSFSDGGQASRDDGGGREDGGQDSDAASLLDKVET
ncbi:hypothetical protein VPH35_092868 [Triticum aestivum]|uniref:uncharacterized protein n=1 Tax=Triticum aestivum TaxID=4565 RepID=UPI0008459766|nr:uncharacterized protein LOC123117110 [Triticum aestivum]